MTSDNNYGTIIKNLRKKLGLTQNEVAEKLNVTPGYISNVENNRTAMSLHVLIYYARLTGLSLDSLIGQVEPEYEATALDNELMEHIRKMDSLTKTKLLNTLKIWEEEC